MINKVYFQRIDKEEQGNGFDIDVADLQLRLLHMFSPQFHFCTICDPLNLVYIQIQTTTTI